MGVGAAPRCTIQLTVYLLGNLARMELEVFETTYSKHQQKIWKKNKTKRLVRRIAKHTAKKQSVK